MLRMFGGSSRDILPTVLQLIFVNKTLELARPVDFTPHAIVRVACQQPLHIGISKFPEFLGVVAVGRIIDYISHSAVWPSSAIFIE
jgi:hypothetical protein